MIQSYISPIHILLIIMALICLPIIAIPVLIFLFIAVVIDGIYGMYGTDVSNKEDFADDYSLRLHEEAINKMRRWNLLHSQRYSNLNNYLPAPAEYRCQAV